MELINNLNRRYATKKFDTLKKIPESHMKILTEAIRLAPSSYGLQLYKVLIIEDEITRAKLRKVSGNQSQVTDSSALVIFCNYINVTYDHVDEYIKRKSLAENKSPDRMKGYGDFIKNDIHSKTKEERDSWTKRQTYIALGFLLAACAELHIDACPMEGFKAKEYNKILGLEEQNLNAAVIAAIGYRSLDDQTQYLPKVRNPVEDLVETIKTVQSKLAA